MTVSQLIEHLKQFDGNLEVATIGHYGEDYDLGTDNFYIYDDRSCGRKDVLRIEPPYMFPDPES